MLNAELERWTTHDFSSGCYPGEDYLEFVKEMEKDLKRQAKENALNVEWFTPNHYSFSACLKNNETDKFVYVMVSDVRVTLNGDWSTHTLYRTMQNPEDYRGGQNMYGPWEDIGKLTKRISK